MKLLKAIIGFLVVNAFFFSSKYSFTGGFNTKELLAVLGLIFYAADILKKSQFTLTKEVFGLLFFSGLISIIAYFTSTYHSTLETTYTTYFLSMLVWLVAAFATIRCLKLLYGEVSVESVSACIVIAALVQSSVAVIADFYEPLDALLLRMNPNHAWVKSVDRLYGFADTSCLDTGGIRYAMAEILCIHLAKKKVEARQFHLVMLYLLIFCIICVTGNMVARTTISGTIVGLVYLAFYLFPKGANITGNQTKLLGSFFCEVAIISIVAVSLYNSNTVFREHTRFAFEGFFSLVEDGHWHTASNAKLAGMYKLPDNAETWIIGDGYFNNPAGDVNYLGEITGGYYMDTDVGYLRFIFYMGLTGLLAFIVFIIYSGIIAVKKNPGYGLLMAIMTSMTFIIWAKVATDCFFILALFICVGYQRELDAGTEQEDEEDDDEIIEDIAIV